MVILLRKRMNIFLKKKIGETMKQTIKNLLMPWMQRLRKIDYIFLHTYYKITKRLNKNKIVMLSDSRKTLSGNLAFIYNELQKYDFNIKTIFKSNLSEKRTWKEKKELMKEVATSKYILIDDFYPIIYPLKLRKKTKLIQVWHAMGAFKTMGFSRVGKPGGPTKSSLTHKNYTDAITSSEEIRKNYAEAFGISIDKIHATGIPRTDIFFDKEYIKTTKENLYKKYPKLKNKKVILYAPTFRGNGQKSAHFDINMIDFIKIKKELKKDYVCIIKMHPFVKQDNLPKEDDFFLNLSEEREINDLLFVTDILITDYSSVIYEYSLLNKPIIFYVPDLEDYIKSRDFYYSFDKYMYGTSATSTEELINQIKHAKLENKKLEEFKKYFCGACDGNSTKRVVEELIINRREK